MSEQSKAQRFMLGDEGLYEDDNHGHWVLYSDYKQLQKENQELKAEAERFKRYFEDKCEELETLVTVFGSDKRHWEQRVKELEEGLKDLIRKHRRGENTFMPIPVIEIAELLNKKKQ